MTGVSGTIAAVALPWVAGFFLLRRAVKIGLLESVFLGYGAGTAILTFWMFALGWLGVPFSALSASILPAIVIAASLTAFRCSGREEKQVSSSPLTPFRTAAAVILSIWIAVKVAFVFHEAFMRPIYSWDAWANWSAGAKLFFHSKGMMIGDPEFFFGKGYRPFLGHPAHTVLLQVWHSLWLGEFHEVYAKSWSFFYYGSLLGLFFTAVRREFSWYPALIALFFLSSMPLLAYHGQDAYADLPLAYFAFSAVFCFWRYVRDREMKYLILSGAFAGFSVFIKNEGAFFALALMLSILIFERAEKGRVFRALGVFAITAVLACGVWMAFKSMYGLGFGHTGPTSGFQWLSDPKFAPGAQKGFHWEVIPAALSELFLKSNFGLAMSFWVAATLAMRKTLAASNIKYLYPVPLAVIALFMFVYVTLEPTAVLESTGVNRNALTYVPIIFFISALLACEALSKKSP